MNVAAKILNKISASLTQPYIKRIIYHNQVGFTSGLEGWFIIHISINMIQQNGR